ncbi:hypothetical protein V9T40_011069 [Parthenolecanium corni]|uniref:WDR59/RTC1-like RING zinc finger domain-containing protein n=1 Tax=Parthenolecanium corni TaxID=536013 RepID=A0AAN9T4T8_9HEMI
MAIRWSSDFVVAEYRELKAKTISLDSSGNYLFIPGKTQLAIKNLNQPIEEISTFPKSSKQEPGAAAWNPHTANADLLALASGIQVELLTWKNNAELCTSKLLKSHTRVITSLNWHPLDPNLLATTSLDTFTFIWDIRESKKPAISLSSFAAATHVKWNKISRHLLATTHGGDVKIWDERKTSSPVQYVSAHLTSIHCLDWSMMKENNFCTASQDGTIKFFDLSYPRRTESVINTEVPVWRACYTPFGRGMLVVIIPTSRKIENSLLLWNLANNSIPLHTFVGHSEIVLDFQWRYFQQDGSDYQLITWSKDQTLRIWEVDKYLQELCGPGNNDLDIDCVDFASETTKETSLTVPDSIKKRFDSIVIEKEPSQRITDDDSDTINEDINLKISSQDILENSQPVDLNSLVKSSTVTAVAPVNLQQEFSANIIIPNVKIVKTDIIRRMCCATAKCNNQVISLLINFPPSYPRNKGPIFRFAQGTSVSNAVRFKILEALRDTADFKVKNNQACLEACLRTLIMTMQQLTSNESEKINLFTDDKLTTLGSNQEAAFLPARTCGAKFCYIGKLVCFAKPMSQLQLSDKNICGLVSLSNRQTEALQRLYLRKNGALPPRTKDMIRRGLLKQMQNTRHNKRTVLIYDVSSLFFLNKELALKYTLSGPDITDICRHNAQVAASVGRKDLQQIWNLVLTSVKSVGQACNGSIDWDCHPLAKQMLQSIIFFYISQSDIQTAASLCCIFRQYLCKSSIQSFKPSKTTSIISKTPSGSPYHNILPNEPSNETAWSYPMRKHIRCNSWSDLYEDIRSSNSIEHAEVVETSELSSISNTYLKDEDNEWLFDRIKQAYADILYRWQLLSVRASVLKCVKASTSEKHKGLEFKAECKQCKSSNFENMCPTCKIPSLYCVICRLSVKGLAYVCLYCGHGGHLAHMKKWYETESCCPVGCKCQCSMSVELISN